MIPVRKKFIIQFNFKKYKQECFFYEGTFGEVSEYQSSLSSMEKIIQKSYEVISQHNEIKLLDFMDTHPEKLLKLCKYILEKWSGGMYQFSKKRESQSKAPNSAWVQNFLKETSHSLQEMRALRWSEIEYLIEGMVWNANEQTKKGRAKNQENIYKKTLKEKANKEVSFEDAKRIANLAP